MAQADRNEDKPVLRCDNIIISAHGMTEAHGDKVVLFVSAADIERALVKFGRAEHRPLFSLFVGAALALAGVFGLIDFFISPWGGYRYELALAAIGVIGGSIIFDVLKECYFLEVTGPKGMRRLVFSKKARKEEICDFYRQAREVYQYQIEEAGPL